MINEKIDLYEYFGIKDRPSGGYLKVYATQIDEIKHKLRPAMLVCPGGAYRFMSEREGEPVAIKFMSIGYSCFVLEYTLCAAYPVPLIEACMAMAFIRENADKYNVDVGHVGAIGFSAGGNLVAMLANIWNAREAKEALGDRVELCRPDAVVLSYAVSTLGIKTHGDTRNVITGGDEKLADRISPEKLVGKNSAPAFIWHTAADDCVPVENSFEYAFACKRAGVPFALHIFERGWHGLSLCSEETSDMTEADIALADIGRWFDLARDWLAARGFTVKTR